MFWNLAFSSSGRAQVRYRIDTVDVLLEGSKPYRSHCLRMFRIWLSTIPGRVYAQSRGGGQIMRALADSLRPILPTDRWAQLRIATQEAERALFRGKDTRLK